MMMWCHPRVNELRLLSFQPERCMGEEEEEEEREGEVWVGGEVEDKERVKWKIEVMGQQL